MDKVKKVYVDSRFRSRYSASNSDFTFELNEALVISDIVLGSGMVFNELWVDGMEAVIEFFLFSSKRRHTRCSGVSWARRCI